MKKGETLTELHEAYGKPIIRFVPNPVPDADFEEIQHDIPKECAVYKIEDRYPGGVIAYARYHELWHANNCERWVIRHLLSLI